MKVSTWTSLCRRSNSASPRERLLSSTRFTWQCLDLLRLQGQKVKRRRQKTCQSCGLKEHLLRLTTGSWNQVNTLFLFLHKLLLRRFLVWSLARPFWFVFFVFPQSIRQMLDILLSIGHDRFLPTFYQQASYTKFGIPCGMEKMKAQYSEISIHRSRIHCFPFSYSNLFSAVPFSSKQCEIILLSSFYLIQSVSYLHHIQKQWICVTGD